MNILDRIVAAKREEIARLPQTAATPELARERLAARGGARDFLGALRNPPQGGPAFIAEIKRASPSAGVIRADFDPVRIARQYEAAGAAALSVLTDGPYFQGSLEHLRAARRATGLPLLRKDFIIDARQILEAIEWGADAVLLIVAILSDAQLGKFLELARSAGLTALVEVHNEAELNRALAVGARLIGVNNRNLETFQVDLETTERLAARIRPQLDAGEILLTAESGIRSAADARRLWDAGARAFLVGESLMRAADPAAKLRALRACIAPES